MITGIINISLILLSLLSSWHVTAIYPDVSPGSHRCYINHDGTRVRRETYTNGLNGTEVILYTIEGGGHTWPSGYQYLSDKIIGKTCRDINACDVIWDFFRRHAKRLP